MQTRNRNTFTTIHTEGALLPVDLLQRIVDNDKGLEGLNPESYHLAPGEKINEAINRSWNRMNGLWGAFRTSRGRLGPGDAGTTLTRERWLLPLFQELGYGRLITSKAVEIEGKSYPISHQWQNVPIHLVGCGLELDKRTPGTAGAARVSPHSLMQEYLNRSEAAQWGLLSNGLRLRILRDNASLTRQAYIDFDLESMFDGEVYSDFVLLWLLAHQSRFELAEKQSECLLERWSKSAQEQGTRALDDLRRGVEEAIVSLGQGFLQHPLNADLRGRLKKGDLLAQDYYRQLLRLVYRLIFLFAAEDRDLLLLPNAAQEAKERFQAHYSTARLRALAERQRGSRHHDRYEALRLVMTLLGSDKGCPELAIPALGGFLFDPRSTADLNDARLNNQSLLNAVRSLAFITEKNTRRAVDYRNLGPEELGSVYESLLELHPMLNIDAGTFQLTSAAGNERKTTGSYYTPSSLIRVLLDSALDPVIEDRLKGKTDSAQQEQALLDIKVCDPACGSGHFLIAAAHRIAGRLAQARVGGDEPPPNETRRALRDVIRHCIYGVDINPMAVELCKVNLWLESLEPGKPLSFLDAHIQCGDSLVGVGPGMDISEIPDEAFNPVFGDDKATASALKKRNKRERSGQMGFRWNATAPINSEDLARWRLERARQVEAMSEDDPTQVQAKAFAFEQYQQAQEYIQNRLEYDLWLAAFFWQASNGDVGSMLAPTQQELVLLRSGRMPEVKLIEKIRKVAEELKFFHWELAFPNIFVGEKGGFDCVLGNPPWDMLQLNPQEFFAFSSPEISEAANTTVRAKMLKKLEKDNPVLYEFYKLANHRIEKEQVFIHSGNKFPLTSFGRINLMSLFAELSRILINKRGMAGLIIPTGIATDSYNQYFFSDVVNKKSLVAFYDFENTDAIFPGVHRSYKFCLATFSGFENERGEFVFFAHSVNDLRNSKKRFALSSDEIALINPNTGTLPIIRTKADGDLNRSIYNRVPVLINQKTESDSWGYRGLLMFYMNTDSHLFLSQPNDKSYRLYEAKMFGQYDHRWATLQDEDADLPLEFKANPKNLVLPRYWIGKEHVDRRLNSWEKKWMICYRAIARATDERSIIVSILPRCGAGNNAPVLLSKVDDPLLLSCLVANFNCIVLDYLARIKIGGININVYIVEQIPVLAPKDYKEHDIDFISQRVLELTYTADDLKAYAESVGYFGEPFGWNEGHRASLRAELDAYYAHLYGLNRKQLRYILDPADLTPRELENILDPWEEVADPLDPQGYAQRAAASDFPGETFRVLKEKEIKQYGEYRTRRLVLEAWERMSASGWTETDGSVPMPQAASRPEPMVEISSQPVEEVVREESKPPAPELAMEDKEELETPIQPALSDFGLYKCLECGKMVMEYEKEVHEREKHGGKSVGWKKVR